MKYWYWLSQNFLIKPVSWVLIHLTHKVKIIGREHFKNMEGPMLIVSNHVVFFDSFLIGLALPFLSPLVPLRYMGEYKEFHHRFLEFLRKIGVMQLLFLIMGVFPSRRGRGIEKAIEIPVEILRRGGTVVMFPEGGVSKIDGLLEFRHGASAIAIKSGVQVLPIFIKKDGGDISMNIGEVFHLANPHPITTEEGTKIIREKVQALAGGVNI